MLTRAQIKRELLIAVILLFIGVVPVPLAVYWVGQQVVGPYEGSSGLFGLMGRIIADLIALRPAAWILVLSPYLTIQLVRAANLGRRRRGSDVNQVTDSE